MPLSLGSQFPCFSGKSVNEYEAVASFRVDDIVSMMSYMVQTPMLRKISPMLQGLPARRQKLQISLKRNAVKNPKVEK